MNILSNMCSTSSNNRGIHLCIPSYGFQEQVHGAVGIVEECDNGAWVTAWKFQVQRSRISHWISRPLGLT